MDQKFIKEIYTSIQFGRLKKSIGKFIQESMDTIDTKISVYINRSFPRWTFNCIKNGKNPFVDTIKASDFVIESDLEYFFSENPHLNFDYKQLNWSWLDEKFMQIHKSIPDQDALIRYEMVSEGCLVIFTSENLVKKCIIKTPQYEMLKRSYIGFPEYFNACIGILIFRYHACGGFRNHCSVPPKIIEYSGAQTEMFGSPFNTHLKQYCSPFFDIEKYFGSLGSFFSFNICSGTYIVNPPYDEELIKASIVKILHALETNNQLTFIFVIPLWDIESREIYKSFMKQPNRDFDSLSVLKNSRYFQSHEILGYTTHKFYDYYEGKHSFITDVHLLVLTNTRYHLNAKIISEAWKLI